jgi:Cdc6-like AAA superfamily ATPase
MGVGKTTIVKQIAKALNIKLKPFTYFNYKNNVCVLGKYNGVSGLDGLNLKSIIEMLEKAINAFDVVIAESVLFSSREFLKEIKNFLKKGYNVKLFIFISDIKEIFKRYSYKKTYKTLSYLNYLERQLTLIKNIAKLKEIGNINYKIIYLTPSYTPKLLSKIVITEIKQRGC